MILVVTGLKTLRMFFEKGPSSTIIALLLQLSSSSSMHPSSASFDISFCGRHANVPVDTRGNSRTNSNNKSRWTSVRSLNTVMIEGKEPIIRAEQHKSSYVLLTHWVFLIRLISALCLSDNFSASMGAKGCAVGDWSTFCSSFFFNISISF